MSNKNKDKEAAKQQPEAGVPINEIEGTETKKDNTTAPGATSDTTEVDIAESSTKVADIKTAKEPKVSDALVKIGESILKSNPAMSVVYMASDGRGFYEKNDADKHAHTLKNKTVTPVKK